MFNSKERVKISAKKKLATIAERDEAAHGVLGDILSAIKARF